MKTVVCIFVALVCSATVTSGQFGIGRGRGCPDICPAIYDPRCGFNQYCVQEFPNSCQLSVANCRSNGAFTQVDLIWCRRAADRRSRGRVRLC